MKKINTLLITVLKVLFFILGVFIILLQLQHFLKSYNISYNFIFNPSWEVNYYIDNYIYYYNNIIFWKSIFLISFILYFINFIFLEKTIKKQNIIINLKNYLYLNKIIQFNLIFSLIFLILNLIFRLNQIDLIELIILTNWIIIVLFTITYILTKKISKILENTKIPLHSTINNISKKEIILIIILILVWYFYKSVILNLFV